MARTAGPSLGRLVVAGAAAIVAAAATASAQDVSDGGGREWTYAGDGTGPADWPSLDPLYAACAGDRQSPIDLSPTRLTGVSSLSRVVSLLPSVFVVNEDKRNSVHYECAYGRCGVTSWGGVDYRLAQLHFHTQSEHTLRGLPTPMEMHLVHLARGQVLVLAVLWVEGPPNAALGALLAATPDANATTITAADWAALTALDGGYCVYEGSATTPDCKQNVVWLVQQRLVAASAAQIDAVRQTFRLLADGRGNWRPTQPANGRSVVCFGAEEGACAPRPPPRFGAYFQAPPGANGTAA